MARKKEVPNLSTSDDLDDFIAEMQERDDKFNASLLDAETRSALLRSLVDARQAAHLTQAAVAETMGTTQSAISELEGGTADPRLSTLQRYARAVQRAVVVVVSPSEPASGLCKVVDLPVGRPASSRTFKVSPSPKPDLIKYGRVTVTFAAEGANAYHRTPRVLSEPSEKELAS